MMLKAWKIFLDFNEILCPLQIIREFLLYLRCPQNFKSLELSNSLSWILKYLNPKYFNAFVPGAMHTNATFAIIEKNKCQIKQKNPRITELRLWPTQMYHTSLARSACYQVVFTIGSIVCNFSGLVLVSSCGYAVVASRLSYFVWILFFKNSKCPHFWLGHVFRYVEWHFCVERTKKGEFDQYLFCFLLKTSSTKNMYISMWLITKEI